QLPNAGSKPSLVRSAIVRLLHQPSLALAVEPPYGFANLRHPGVELLVELLGIVQARPEISTGALLEHFAERDELAALQKLAMQQLPGEETHWRAELLDAVAQLEKQTLQQRLEELQAKHRETGLDDADKYELRALLQARATH
ncbi:MAG TPA: DNA primase, partial [Pseudoxanthomonas sp.]|nr:DNA primase [Pseudoxanthomonas sp.]